MYVNKELLSQNIFTHIGILSKTNQYAFVLNKSFEQRSLSFCTFYIIYRRYEGCYSVHYIIISCSSMNLKRIIVGTIIVVYKKCVYNIYTFI